MRKLFSIVTVNFNNSVGLNKTIESVKKQSFQDFDFTIIDGGSTDDSLNLINKNSKFINNIVSEKDFGIYDAMNKGLRFAKGQYAYFLNSGDVFFSNETLQKLNLEIKNNSYPDLIYGSCLISFNYRKNFIKSENLSLNELKFGVKVPQQAYFIKNEVIQKIKFDQQYKIAADFQVLCKVFADKTLKIKRTNQIICNYDGEGVSSNLSKSYKDTEMVIKNEFGKFYAFLYSMKSKVKLVANFMLFNKKNQ